MFNFIQSFTNKHKLKRTKSRSSRDSQDEMAISVDERALKSQQKAQYKWRQPGDIVRTASATAALPPSTAVAQGAARRRSTGRYGVGVAVQQRISQLDELVIVHMTGAPACINGTYTNSSAIPRDRDQPSNSANHRPASR